MRLAAGQVAVHVPWGSTLLTVIILRQNNSENLGSAGCSLGEAEQLFQFDKFQEEIFDGKK